MNRHIGQRVTLFSYPLLQGSRFRRSKIIPSSDYALASTNTEHKIDGRKKIIKKGSNQRNGPMDVYSKVLEYLPNFNSYNEQSGRVIISKHINDSLKPKNAPTRRRSLTTGTADSPEFPYWNLLRQKWLLSAQPRRLSQVRLFKKGGTTFTRNNSVSKRSFFSPSNDGINKRSFFYLFKLLKRSKDRELNDDKNYYVNYHNIYPYLRCYLNNVACWGK